MELKAIEQLLEKYLEAETSLKEEAQLRAYFSSDNVAPHLQDYASMFVYFSASKGEAVSLNLSKAFEDKLAHRQTTIDNEGEETLRKTQRDNNDPASLSLSNSTKAKTERKRVYSWVAVAASIVIMAGVFFQENPAVNEFGSYEDPEVAMEKTKEALNMVSLLMHSGNDELSRLQEFENTKNRILK